MPSYSRKILWLEAASTNNNPRCIAHYFITCVKENSGKFYCKTNNSIMLEGCPQVLRTDRGIENSLLAVIQPMLRHCHSDDFAQHRSHIYGRSTSNQVRNIIIAVTDCYYEFRELKYGGVSLENNTWIGG